MRNSFTLLVLSGISACGRAESASTATPVRPNVVFVLADDLGWSDTTLYGGTKLYRTPNIERLARQGMTFTHAYSASSVCSPTRASILTGLSPARTGITTPSGHEETVLLEAKPGKRAPPDASVIMPIPVTRLGTQYVTLAEALKDAGYATGHFGKWHLGPEPYSPLQHGFDVDVPHWPGSGPGGYLAPWKFQALEAREPGEHIEDRMAQEAVAFMERHKDEPFFLNYWMFSVHPPFEAKQELVEAYGERVDPADAQRSPTYAAMVESLDDAVGTLLDALERLGIADKTIVVFTSDNGGNELDELDETSPTSNRPLRGGKATIYEGGIRVPCVVSWPGAVAGGTRSESVVQSTDFYPTLLEMLDLEPREGQRFDGISFVPALHGRPLEREAIFTFLPQVARVRDWLPPGIAVHRDDWKLIRLFHCGEEGAHRWKLYDLGHDLGETRDLAAREPERVRAMDALIERYLSETRAVVPVANPRFDPAAYDPGEEGKPMSDSDPRPRPKVDDPALQGWKPRHARASVADGIVTLRGTGKMPNLGIEVAPTEAADGGAEVRLRARSLAGGAGSVDALPRGEDGPREVVGSEAFRLRPGDWQVIEVRLRGGGLFEALRVCLPAEGQSVEVDWIEFSNAGVSRRWEF